MPTTLRGQFALARGDQFDWYPVSSLSKDSHSSSHQLLERLSRNNFGRTIGYEAMEELKKLNDNIEKVYVMVIVMIFHSVVQYVPGDFLVENNGRTIDWYFNKSKYITLIEKNLTINMKDKQFLMN